MLLSIKKGLLQVKNIIDLSLYKHVAPLHSNLIKVLNIKQYK